MNWPIVLNVIVYALATGGAAALTAWQMDATHQWTPALVTGGITALTYLTGRMQQSPREPRRAYPWDKKKLGLVLLLALPLVAGCARITAGTVSVYCAGKATVDASLLLGRGTADCGDGFVYKHEIVPAK